MSMPQPVLGFKSPSNTSPDTIPTPPRTATTTRSSIGPPAKTVTNPAPKTPACSEGNSSPTANGAKMTTRSGRTITYSQAAEVPQGNKDRKPSVPSDFARVEQTQRYQGLLQETAIAQTPNDIVQAEMKLWNVRHRYAPEGSNSKHAMTGERLVSFLGKRWDERLDSVSGLHTEHRSEQPAANQDGDVSGDGPVPSGASAGPDVASDIRNVEGSGARSTLIEKLDRAAGRNTPHPTLRAAFKRAIQEHEAMYGPIDSSLDAAVKKAYKNARKRHRIVPRNRSLEVMEALLAGLGRPQPESEPEPEPEPELETVLEREASLEFLATPRERQKRSYVRRNKKVQFAEAEFSDSSDSETSPPPMQAKRGRRAAVTRDQKLDVAESQDLQENSNSVATRRAYKPRKKAAVTGSPNSPPDSPPQSPPSSLPAGNRKRAASGRRHVARVGGGRFGRIEDGAIPAPAGRGQRKASKKQRAYSPVISDLVKHEDRYIAKNQADPSTASGRDRSIQATQNRRGKSLATIVSYNAKSGNTSVGGTVVNLPGAAVDHRAWEIGQNYQHPPNFDGNRVALMSGANSDTANIHGSGSGPFATKDQSYPYPPVSVGDGVVPMNGANRGTVGGHASAVDPLDNHYFPIDAGNGAAPMSEVTRGVTNVHVALFGTMGQSYQPPPNFAGNEAAPMSGANGGTANGYENAFALFGTLGEMYQYPPDFAGNRVAPMGRANGGAMNDRGNDVAPSGTMGQFYHLRPIVAEGRVAPMNEANGGAVNVHGNSGAPLGGSYGNPFSGARVGTTPMGEGNNP